jgi:hypothetical protein
MSTASHAEVSEIQVSLLPRLQSIQPSGWEKIFWLLFNRQLDRPVLAGQSIAGEELNWIGTFHPDMVAGLTFLRHRRRLWELGARS